MERKKEHWNLYYIFQEDQKEHPPPDELVKKLWELLWEHQKRKT